MIEKILLGEQLIALIIRTEFNQEGICFFTPDDFSQQLAYMKRPEGYKIKAHMHNVIDRKVSLTQEVLFIKSGRVRIDFFDNQKVFLESKILQKGDVILLASGGHGFEMLEECEMIEVKQGPYSGDRDKILF